MFPRLYSNLLRNCVSSKISASAKCQHKPLAFPLSGPEPFSLPLPLNLATDLVAQQPVLSTTQATYLEASQTFLFRSPWLPTHFLQRSHHLWQVQRGLHSHSFRIIACSARVRPSQKSAGEELASSQPFTQQGNQ